MTTIYYVFQNAVVLLLIWMNSKPGKIFTLNMHVKINASLYSLMFVDYVRIVIVNGESWYGLWRTMMPGVKYHSYEKRCLWPTEGTLANCKSTQNVWWLRKGKSSKKVISLNSLGTNRFLTLSNDIKSKNGMKVHSLSCVKRNG